MRKNVQGFIVNGKMLGFVDRQYPVQLILLKIDKYLLKFIITLVSYLFAKKNNNFKFKMDF